MKYSPAFLASHVSLTSKYHPQYFVLCFLLSKQEKELCNYTQQNKILVYFNDSYKQNMRKQDSELIISRHFLNLICS